MSSTRLSAMFSIALSAVTLGACQTSSPNPMPTIGEVDLERFAGQWFVIASIPTFLERDAYNAIEYYDAPVNGRIDTTFTFNKGSSDGPLRRYTPTAFVSEQSDAVWGMQFLWPFRAEYRIVHLDDDYQYTIIGRTARDYVWIMARQSDISASDYTRLVEEVASLGYDTGKLVRIPHAT